MLFWRLCLWVGGFERENSEKSEAAKEDSAGGTNETDKQTVIIQYKSVYCLSSSWSWSLVFLEVGSGALLEEGPSSRRRRAELGVTSSPSPRPRPGPATPSSSDSFSSHNNAARRNLEPARDFLHKTTTEKKKKKKKKRERNRQTVSEHCRRPKLQEFVSQKQNPL
jgi:hypothetical protein